MARGVGAVGPWSPPVGARSVCGEETHRFEGEDAMKALRLEQWNSDPVPVEVDRPEPRPGEVVVRAVVVPEGGRS